MPQSIDTADLQQFVFKTLEDFGAEGENIALQATLEGLDIDSLDLVELGQVIEERYGVRLAAEEFKGVKTVGDALEVIRKQLDG
jgi:acyl carrier protein